jgi:hypothetical protein
VGYFEVAGTSVPLSPATLKAGGISSFQVQCPSALATAEKEYGPSYKSKPRKLK